MSSTPTNAHTHTALALKNINFGYESNEHRLVVFAFASRSVNRSALRFVGMCVCALHLVARVLLIPRMIYVTNF